jgi:AraC family transcriptional regulator
MFRCYRDWYLTTPLVGIPGALRTIDAGPIDLIKVAAPAGGVIEPAVPEYALQVILQSAPLMRLGFNRPPRWLAVSPGSMMLAPPDTACEYAGDGSDVLSIAIPTTYVDDFTEATGARLHAEREEAFRNPRVVQSLVRLWHALADANGDATGGALLADAVMRPVLAALATRHPSAPVSEERAPREQLAHHTVRRLRDFIEARLSDDLDIPMLAAVANLSPAHFARAFAATVGMTPFRYVMTRRLTRARDLLAQTSRPTLDIALDVGFKTPSHFTSRFRQEFGITPSAIRPRRRLVGSPFDLWHGRVSGRPAIGHDVESVDATPGV